MTSQRGAEEVVQDCPWTSQVPPGLARCLLDFQSTCLNYTSNRCPLPSSS